MSILRTVSNLFRNNAKLPEVGRGSETFNLAQKPVSQNVAAMESYNNNNIVHAIVANLASEVSAVEWKLYRKQDDSRNRYAYDDTDDRVEVKVHPALTIWNKPNHSMTRQQLVETIQQWLDTTGEGWLNVEYGRGGTPLNLWPKRPDKMIVVPSADNFIAGYVYVGPDGERVPLKRDEMIQLRMPNPLDMFRGIGPIQSLSVDLDAARYAALYNRNFFLNDATPGGIIEVPENISEENWEKFVKQWRETHKGVHNSNKMAVLQDGMKYVNNSVTMRDMQFPELRKISDDAIMRAFGFPKFKLGIVDDINRATADAQELFYIRSLLKPRLERIKQALNNAFLPLFGVTGQGVEFDYICDEPEDEMSEAQVRLTNAQMVKTLIDSGFDPSMALEAGGFQPMMHRGLDNKTISGTIVPNENAGGEPNEVVRSNNQE